MQVRNADFQSAVSPISNRQATPFRCRNKQVENLRNSRLKICVTVLLLGVIGLFTANATFAADNADCLACHSDKDLTKRNNDGRTISLFVDEGKFASSIHGSNACRSCHVDITESPHPDGFVAKPAQCSQCHNAQSETYRASVHGMATQNGEKNAASCHDCHG